MTSREKAYEIYLNICTHIKINDLPTPFISESNTIDVLTQSYQWAAVSSAPDGATEICFYSFYMLFAETVALKENRVMVHITHHPAVTKAM